MANTETKHPHLLHDLKSEKVTVRPRESTPSPFDSGEPRIYSGDMFTQDSGSQAARTEPERQVFTTPRSQKIVRRKMSPFNIVVFLFVFAVAIVLYISNIIAVDQLMNEINALENQHQQILMEQEMLKMQINRMSSLERIRQRAEEDLGLKTPNEPPVTLKVEQQKITDLEKALNE